MNWLGTEDTFINVVVILQFHYNLKQFPTKMNVSPGNMWQYLGMFLVVGEAGGATGI